MFWYSYVMDYVQKTIAAYDNSPDKYASATTDMVNEQEMEALVKYMPTGAQTILDVGCAFGRDCEAFKERGLCVTGIDMSTELLKRATELKPGIEFLQMDVRELSFSDHSFSAIWCNAVLLHLNDSDLVKALRELHRVMVEGGAIAISVKLGEGEKTFIEDFSSNQERYYNFKAEDSLNRLLTDNGFTVRESYILNEREHFGPSKRDLNWVWSFANAS